MFLAKNRTFGSINFLSEPLVSSINILIPFLVLHPVMQGDKSFYYFGIENMSNIRAWCSFFFCSKRMISVIIVYFSVSISSKILSYFTSRRYTGKICVIGPNRQKYKNCYAKGSFHLFLPIFKLSLGSQIFSLF